MQHVWQRSQRADGWRTSSGYTWSTGGWMCFRWTSSPDAAVVSVNVSLLQPVHADLRRSHTGRDERTMKGSIPRLRSCMTPNVYPRAPDGGWGWVVAVAFFFVEVFTYGIIKVFGIFLEDLTNHFGETNSRVSWIISICVFIMMFTGYLFIFLA